MKNAIAVSALFVSGFLWRQAEARENWRSAPVEAAASAAFSAVEGRAARVELPELRLAAVEGQAVPNFMDIAVWNIQARVGDGQVQNAVWIRRGPSQIYDQYSYRSGNWTHCVYLFQSQQGSRVRLEYKDKDGAFRFEADMAANGSLANGVFYRPDGGALGVWAGSPGNPASLGDNAGLAFLAFNPSNGNELPVNVVQLMPGADTKGIPRVPGVNFIWFAPVVKDLPYLYWDWTMVGPVTLSAGKYYEASIGGPNEVGLRELTDPDSLRAVTPDRALLRTRNASQGGIWYATLRPPFAVYPSGDKVVDPPLEKWEVSIYEGANEIINILGGKADWQFLGILEHHRDPEKWVFKPANGGSPVEWEVVDADVGKNVFEIPGDRYLIGNFSNDKMNMEGEVQEGWEYRGESQIGTMHYFPLGHEEVVGEKEYDKNPFGLHGKWKAKRVE